MAVNSTSIEAKLKFQFDGGVDENGKAILKTKTYSKVKPASTNDDVYAVAQSVAGLQGLPVVAIRKIEEVELTQV